MLDKSLTLNTPPLPFDLPNTNILVDSRLNDSNYDQISNQRHPKYCKCWIPNRIVVNELEVLELM